MSKSFTPRSRSICKTNDLSTPLTNPPLPHSTLGCYQRASLISARTRYDRSVAFRRFTFDNIELSPTAQVHRFSAAVFFDCRASVISGIWYVGEPDDLLVVHLTVFTQSRQRYYQQHQQAEIRVDLIMTRNPAPANKLRVRWAWCSLLWE